MDWYREFHTGIPVLPMKGPAETTLVTSSEVELVSRLGAKLGVSPVVQVFSVSPSIVLGTKETYLEIKQELERAGRN